MFFGTRVGQRIGASVLAITLAAGIAGSAIAQDASPEASPMASPVAGMVTSDLPAAPLLSETEIEGDSTTIGVTFGGDSAGIAVEGTETRPTVVLQTTNATGGSIEVALFQVPEAYDPATFSLADYDGTLPDGFTAVGAYALEDGEVDGAVFENVPLGSYVVAATSGESFAFVLTEPVPVEVPDIFASPEATPAT